MPRLSDLGRNVVDRDDAVDQHDDHEKQQTKCEVIQEWVFRARSQSLWVIGAKRKRRGGWLVARAANSRVGGASVD